MIEQLFLLTTSGDPASIADCFGSAWLSAMDSATLRRWALSGPASQVTIAKLDTVGSRDRFRVTVSLARGDMIDWPMPTTRFFSVAQDGDAPRIVEVATALSQ